MSETTFSVDELQALVDVVCDGTPTERDVVQIERLLCGNAKARRLYLTQVRLDRWLRWEFARQVQEPASPHPFSLFPGFLSPALHGTLGYFSSGWPLAYLIATVMTGLGLLIGSSRLCSIRADRQAIVIAHIESYPSRKWSGRPDHRHGRLPVGKDGVRYSSTVCRWVASIELASGLMEITYDTGAKVILQGPVTYEVESRMAGIWRSGS